MCIVSAIDGFIIQNKKRIRQNHDTDEGVVASSSSSEHLHQLMSDRIVNDLLSRLDSNHINPVAATPTAVVARRSIPAAGTPAALSKLVLQTMRTASVAWSGVERMSSDVSASTATSPVSQTSSPRSSWEAASQYYCEAIEVMNKLEEKLASVLPTNGDGVDSNGSVMALLNHPNCPIRPLVTTSQQQPSSSSSSPIPEELIPVSILREVVMPGVLSEITAGAIPMVVADSWSLSLQMLASLKANNADHLLPVDTAMMLMECVILQPMLAQRVRRYQHLVDNCQREKNATTTTTPPEDSSAVNTKVPKLVIPAVDGATATEYNRMKAIVSDMQVGLSMLDVPLPVARKAKLCWMLLRTVQHQERLLGNAINNSNTQHSGEKSGGAFKHLDINVLSEPRTAAAANRVLCSSSTLGGFLSLEQTCALLACSVNRMALTQRQQQTHHNKQHQQQPSSSFSPLEELVNTGAIASLLRCMSGHGGAIVFSRKRQTHNIQDREGEKGDGSEHHNQRSSSLPRHLLSGQDLVDVIMSQPTEHHPSNTTTHQQHPPPPYSITHLQGAASWKAILHGDVLINTIIAILKKETAMDAFVRGGNISVNTLGALECAELVADLLTRGILAWKGGYSASTNASKKPFIRSQFANSAASEFLDTIRTILLVRKVLPGGAASSSSTTNTSDQAVSQAQLSFSHYDTHLPLIRRLERIVARNMVTKHMAKRSGVWEEALLLCKDRRQGWLTLCCGAGEGATVSNCGVATAVALENEMRTRGQTSRGHFELSEDLRHVQTSILVHALGNIVESGGSGVKATKGDLNSGIVLQRLLADGESRLTRYISSIIKQHHQDNAGNKVPGDAVSGKEDAVRADGTVIQITPDEALLTFLFGPQWLPAPVRRVVLQNAATGVTNEQQKIPSSERIGDEDLKLLVTRSLRAATLKCLSFTNTGGFIPIREILQGGRHVTAGATGTPLRTLDDDFENPYQPLNVHYDLLLAALQHTFVLQAAPVRSFCGHALPLPYTNSARHNNNDDKTGQSVQIEREGELVWRLGMHALRTAPFPSLLKCLQTLSLCSRPVYSSSGGAAAGPSDIVYVADSIKAQIAHSSNNKLSVTPSAYNRSRQLAIDIADAINHSSQKGLSLSSSATAIPWNCWRVALGVCQHLVEVSEVVSMPLRSSERKGSSHQRRSDQQQLLDSDEYHKTVSEDATLIEMDVLSIMKDRSLGSLKNRIEASRQITKVSATSTHPYTPAEQLLLALRKLSLRHREGR
jgi:hypothetical protein